MSENFLLIFEEARHVTQVDLVIEAIYMKCMKLGIQLVALLYSGHQITPIRWPWR